MIKYTAEVYSGVSESSSHQNLRFTQRERENETSRSETDIKTLALCNKFPVTSKKEVGHRDYSEQPIGESLHSDMFDIWSGLSTACVGMDPVLLSPVSQHGHLIHPYSN